MKLNKTNQSNKTKQTNKQTNKNRRVPLCPDSERKKGFFEEYRFYPIGCPSAFERYLAFLQVGDKPETSFQQRLWQNKGVNLLEFIYYSSNLL